MSNNTQSRALPVTGELTRSKLLSIVVAVLMGVLSLIGLLFPDIVYPSEEAIQSLRVNDLINLVIGLPILLGSMWLTFHGKLVGLLFWPGALLYVLYNYIPYVLAITFSALTFAYLTLVLLSVYIIYDLLRSIDSKSVKDQLSGAVSEKIGGWFLLVFGVLFIGRAISEFAPAIMDQAPLPPIEIGVLIGDIVISILWIIGGIFLLRRKPLGYSSGLGLLFAASMLFIGLILFLLIQPLLTNAPFSMTDVIVIAVMGLILSIPFVLFLRGVIKSS